MMELKNFEPKTKDEILLSIYFDNCEVVYNSDLHRKEDKVNIKHSSEFIISDENED